MTSSDSRMWIEYRVTNSAGRYRGFAAKYEGLTDAPFSYVHNTLLFLSRMPSPDRYRGTEV